MADPARAQRMAKRISSIVASAIAQGDVAGAGEALDRLVDNVEAFARATVALDRL